MNSCQRTNMLRMPLQRRLMTMRCLVVFITALVGNCSYGHNLDVLFRVAYFTPQDSHFRKTYHTGWADYQIEAGYHSCSLCCFEFDPWINFHARVRSGSLKVGAKKIFCFSCLDCLSPYLDLGVGIG